MIARTPPAAYNQISEPSEGEIGLSDTVTTDNLTSRFYADLGKLWSGRPRELLVAACSGGPDSTALLDLLARARDVYGYTLAAACLDHGLRGEEGAEDARAVKSFCDRLGAAFYTDTVDCRDLAERKTLSLEDACRRARYDFLDRIRTETGAVAVATGHTADDNAETVLMNLLRGAGSRGLSGIPSRRDWVIRPLLGFWREELMAYLSARGLPFQEDKTNLDDSFFRNRVRRRLIPFLERDYNPNIKRGLVQAADIFDKEEDVWKEIQAEAQQASDWQSGDGRISMALDGFRSLKPALQRRLVREGLAGPKKYLRGVSFDNVESVLDTAARDAGAVDLPDNRRAWISAGRLYLGLDFQDAPQVETPLPAPGLARLPELDVEIVAEALDENWPSPESTGPDRAILDLDKLSPPFLVRNTRPGDRFRPLGLAGTKKLSDFFIDLKVPRHHRSYVPLVVDRGEVVWVAGYRPSERARVDSGTKRVVILTVGRLT